MEPIAILERNGQKTDADIWDRIIKRDNGPFVELKDTLDRDSKDQEKMSTHLNLHRLAGTGGGVI